MCSSVTMLVVEDTRDDIDPISMSPLKVVSERPLFDVLLLEVED